MNRHRDGIGCKSQERFRLRFQRRLRAALGNQRSVAEGFGPAWEQTLAEVTLNDTEQGQIYRQLLRWAASDELFTVPASDQLLQAWKDTVVDEF